MSAFNPEYHHEADDLEFETADPFDDEQPWTREQVRHTCGHTVGYSTPEGWPAQPVDASKPCWHCQMAAGDPFGD